MKNDTVKNNNEMMQNEIINKIKYSKKLLDLAKESKKENLIHEQIKSVVDYDTYTTRLASVDMEHIVGDINNKKILFKALNKMKKKSSVRDEIITDTISTLTDMNKKNKSTISLKAIDSIADDAIENINWHTINKRSPLNETDLSNGEIYLLGTKSGKLVISSCSIECYIDKLNDDDSTSQSISRCLGYNKDLGTFVTLEDAIVKRLYSLPLKEVPMRPLCTLRVVKTANKVFLSTSNVNGTSEFPIVKTDIRLTHKNPNKVNKGKVEKTTDELVKRLSLLLHIYPKQILFYTSPLNAGEYLYDMEDIVIKEKDKYSYHIETDLYTHELTLKDIYKRSTDPSKGWLLHYPYDSYDKFINLLYQMSKTRNVKHIYMTIYRTDPFHKKYDKDTPKLIDALNQLLLMGKELHLFIEERAEYSEIDNRLFKARLGVHENAHVYSIPLENKVHLKAMYVEFSNMKPLAGVFTGNFNTLDEERRDDLCYFTRDPEITNPIRDFFGGLEVSCITAIPDDLFNSVYLNGSDKIYFTKSPNNNLVDKLKQEIRYCIDSAEKGGHSFITIKCNSISNKEIADMLIEAANKGVCVLLLVRKDCCIESGKNIDVISTVGHVIEHSRVFYFSTYNQYNKLINHDVFISSADIRNKSFNRYEMMALITDSRIEAELPMSLFKEMHNNKRSYSSFKKYSDLLLPIDKMPLIGSYGYTDHPLNKKSLHLVCVDIIDPKTGEPITDDKKSLRLVGVDCGSSDDHTAITFINPKTGKTVKTVTDEDD
jgi:polyphosphate kinase